MILLITQIPLQVHQRVFHLQKVTKYVILHAVLLFCVVLYQQ